MPFWHGDCETVAVAVGRPLNTDARRLTFPVNGTETELPLRLFRLTASHGPPPAVHDRCPRWDRGEPTDAALTITRAGPGSGFVDSRTRTPRPRGDPPWPTV